MKIKRLVFILLLTLLFAVSASPAYAWWSFPDNNNTHERLSKCSLNVIKEISNCYDMWFYYETVWGATQTPANDTFAHGGNPGLNDGPYAKFWNEALKSYKNKNFQDAYSKIGSMAHLVEDMGVPAHAFDIYHAFNADVSGDWGDLNTKLDAFEMYSAEIYPPSINLSDVLSVPSLDPWWYMDNFRDRTRQIINNDIVPAPPGRHWNEYWRDKYSGEKEDYHASNVFKGRYGKYSFSRVSGNSYEKALNTYILKETLKYTAKMLMQVSMKLPPMSEKLSISGLTSGSPAIDVMNGSNISLNVSENRTQKVSAVVTVDGTPISQPNGSLVDEYEVILNASAKGQTPLPWNGSLSKNWNGKLKNGQYVKSGIHHLCVWIKDSDGNYSDCQFMQFSIKTPLEVSVSPDMVKLEKGYTQVHMIKIKNNAFPEGSEFVLHTSVQKNSGAWETDAANLDWNTVNIDKEFVTAFSVSNISCEDGGVCVKIWVTAKDTNGKEYQDSCEVYDYMSKYEPPDDGCKILRSYDPNDIIGPVGFGDAKWITGDSNLGYTIRFENDEKLATAPAQKVVVEQVLDKNIDLRTFRLGSFGFGSHVYEVPEKCLFYQTRIDLTSEMGMYVKLNAGIDVVNRKVFWVFESIDPATGKAPEDATKGFLPPDKAEGEGQGFVSYSAKAVSSAKTGDKINAVARIVFDTNEEINTPKIFNTLDTEKPTSTLHALPAETHSNEVILEWDTSDGNDGSGIKSTDILVSKDGGDFEIAVEGAKSQTAKYSVKDGHTYSFFAVAADNAGNRETMKSQAEVSTSSIVDGVPADITVSTDVKQIEAGGTGVVSITAFVKDGKGKVIADRKVNFTASLGSLSATSAVTDKNGIAVVKLNAGKAIGTSVIKAMVNEADRELTGTTVIQIEDMTIKGLNFTVSTAKAKVGSDVIFNSKMEAGTGVEYEWDFGDGSSGSGASVSHKYSKSGIYDVLLMAMNSKGVLTVQTKVAVQSDTTTNGSNDGENKGGGNNGETEKKQPPTTQTPAEQPKGNEGSGEEKQVNYKDIEGHWAEQNIRKLINEGIISGYSDGTIKPDTEITRAEIITIIVKALGISPDNGTGLKFKDAENIPEWAKGYISTAVKYGIASGYDDGTFRPSKKLTRAEMLVMIIKASKNIKLNETKVKFADSVAIPQWSDKYISAAYSLGVVKGYPDNTIRPNTTTTRAEAFTVIIKIIDIIKNKP